MNDKKKVRKITLEMTKGRKIRGASTRIQIANVIFNPKTPRANGYFLSKVWKKIK